MTLRLHRVSDPQWRRLAAARRNEDFAGAPPRAAIRAIEVEVRRLDRQVGTPDDDLRRTAAG